jgi:hypothetical protein
LEILVGFHAIDRFAQFVEIADSVAIAIGIKKPPYGFGHDVQLVDGKVASVPIQRKRCRCSPLQPKAMMSPKSLSADEQMTALGQSRLLPEVGRSAASPRAADIKSHEPIG